MDASRVFKPINSGCLHSLRPLSTFHNLRDQSPIQAVSLPAVR